jgi:hypothetical protein
MDHSCVHLGNGWYGINSIIAGFHSILNSFEYDELQLPTISTKEIFGNIAGALRGDFDARILTITHAGLHELEEPYCLSSRPDLVIPQIVKITARSYRDLPVRRVTRGFRYSKPSGPVSVSLVTDSEMTALDAEGIFASAEEYDRELAVIGGVLEEFLKEKLKLSTFAVTSGISRIYFSLLPDGSALEVARIRLFGQALAKAIGFQVLQPTNRPEPPFILNLTINSTLFAAVIAAHSQPGKVILPAHTLRAFGTSYGVDVSRFTEARFDTVQFPFTSEKFAKLQREGGLFALLPTADGNVELRSADGSEVLEAGAVEANVLAIIAAREDALKAAEKAAFETRLAESVAFIPEGGAIPDGLVVLGAKVGAAGVTVAAKPFLPVAP